MIEICTCLYCGKETTKPNELNVEIYDENGKFISKADVCEACQLIATFTHNVNFKKNGKII